MNVYYIPMHNHKLYYVYYVHMLNLVYFTLMIQLIVDIDNFNSWIVFPMVRIN